MAELGRELDDVDAFVDQQAREAAAQVARPRVRWETDGGGHGLEDPLAPVVPVVPGPALPARGGEQEAFLARGPPQPPAAKVACERIEQPRFALDHDAALG